MPDNMPSAHEVSFWIDGREARAAEGSQLLQSILKVTEIPHICYHSDLMGPIRSCDTCLVEVNGRLPKLLRALQEREFERLGSNRTKRSMCGW